LKNRPSTAYEFFQKSTPRTLKFVGLILITG
jgi:hypothetical protein